MKRLLSILVLSLLLLHFAGFYVYFIVRLRTIHAEAKASLKNLPEEKLTRLSFTKEEYQKAKVGDDEIKWQAKMYDIARVEQSPERIAVFALQDEAEDNLLSFIQKVISRARGDKRQTPGSLNSFFSLVYVQPPIYQSPFCTEVKSSTPNFYLINFQTISLQIDSPPPQG